MAFGKRIDRTVILVAALALAGCSSSGGGGSSNSVTALVQDLTLDPVGLTVIVTFAKDPGALSAANFEANGTQNPLGVVMNGPDATITWDARVTASHQLRVLGVKGVQQTFQAVTSSDVSAPALSFTSAAQTVGLGGDTLSLAFTGGPRVVESSAEDISSWDLVVNGQSLDLAGSTFDLDPATQTLSVTLGPDANLHSTFTIAASGLRTVADVLLAATPVPGSASDDATAPVLISALQNIDDLAGGSEFGNVLEFTFSEAMDPLNAVGVARYQAALPNIATGVEALNGGTTLRVTFTSPVIPGTHTVDLNALLDAHGIPFPNVTQAITAGSTVLNAFDGMPVAAAVADAGNDTVVIATTQAFDPSDAVDPLSWNVVVGGTPLVLSDHQLDYDFLGKTLTMTLVNVDMPFGAVVNVTGVNVLEVDGELFGLATAINVTGDNLAPSVLSVVQNRNQDPNGTIVDVVLSEDVQSAEAEDVLNWSMSGALNVIGASLLSGQSTVRLTLDAAAIPGVETLTVSNLRDLANNLMPAPDAGNAVTSTDTTPPSGSAAAASAIEGADNDTVAVTFSDDMISSEVEDPNNWVIESPVGSAMGTVGSTVSYNSGSRIATFTFGSGNPLFFKRGNDFQVSFVSMRDLGGNVVTNTTLNGNVVAESNLPEVHTIWRDSADNGEIVIRFTEHCDLLDDLYNVGTNPTGTRFFLRDNASAPKGFATTAVPLDGGLGVRVGFGQTIAVDDRVDVLGCSDLAGNYMFPTMDYLLVAEDDGLPASLTPGISSLEAIRGEDNDTISVVFDRPLSPWNALNSANYTLTKVAPLQTINLSNALITFDGVSTLTISLSSMNSENLQFGDDYNITANNVWSAQGAELTVTESENNVTVIGDGTLGSDPPDVTLGDVTVDPIVPNALLIVADEPLDLIEAQIAANYTYDIVNVGVSATRLGPRTIRVTFGVQPVAGNMLDMTITDLAGNSSGLLSVAVSASDLNAPLVSSVEGIAGRNEGFDRVTISFDEPIDPTTGLNIGNYSVTNGIAPVDISNAGIAYNSGANVITLHLPVGQELDVNSGIVVNVSGIMDHSGNAMPTPVAPAGAVNGDMQVPGFDRSFINYRENASGLVIDVLIDEDVDQSSVTNPLSWSPSGGQFVTQVVSITPRYVRLTLNVPLAPGDTLDMLGLVDLAQNSSGAISTEPTP